MTFQPESIHSVVNETDRVTVSLHVYGKHPNYTGRSQFDPEERAEKAFIFKSSKESGLTGVNHTIRLWPATLSGVT